MPKKKKKKNPEYNKGYYRNKKLKSKRQKELNASKDSAKIENQGSADANSNCEQTEELEKDILKDNASKLRHGKDADPIEMNAAAEITLSGDRKLQSRKSRKLARYLEVRNSKKLARMGK
jgi:hypothetical protein